MSYLLSKLRILTTFEIVSRFEMTRIFILHFSAPLSLTYEWKEYAIHNSVLKIKMPVIYDIGDGEGCQLSDQDDLLHQDDTDTTTDSEDTVATCSARASLNR